MTTTRDDFSRATVLALMVRVAGFCSRPECGRLTVHPDPLSPSAYLNTGRAAHITAAQLGGPRFDAALTSAARKSAENGIWLCAGCADLVDKNAGDAFPVELLQGWKNWAEQRTGFAGVLATAARRPRWIDHIGSPHFINLPRIAAAWPETVPPGTMDRVRDGFPGGEILDILLAAQMVLRNLTVRAVDVEQLVRPADQVAAGMAVAAWRGFRTKNGTTDTVRDVANYSFDRSPLVYTKAHGWRYVFPYDPRWVTTMTARASMRAGRQTLAVLGIVKDADVAAQVAVCTPLAIGVPDLFSLHGIDA